MASRWLDTSTHLGFDSLTIHRLEFFVGPATSNPEDRLVGKRARVPFGSYYQTCQPILPLCLEKKNIIRKEWRMEYSRREYESCSAAARKENRKGREGGKVLQFLRFKHLYCIFVGSLFLNHFYSVPKVIAASDHQDIEKWMKSSGRLGPRF